MKSADITLLSPPSRSFNHYRPPLALIYLAGYLEKQGFNSNIIDITEKSIIKNSQFFHHLKKRLTIIENEILKQIKKNPSPIYGITCYTPEYFEVLKLAQKVKKINPKAIIIAVSTLLSIRTSF